MTGFKKAKSHNWIEADNAFGDNGITIGPKINPTVLLFCSKPNFALTAFDDVLVRFELRVDQGERFS